MQTRYAGVRAPAPDGAWDNYVPGRTHRFELVGVDEERIVSVAQNLLDDQAAYDRMAKSVNPYGDGRACGRIVEAIRYFLDLRAARPDDVFDPLKHSSR